MDPDAMDPEDDEQEDQSQTARIIPCTSMSDSPAGRPSKKQIEATADSGIDKPDSETECQADPESSMGLLQATYQYSTTIKSAAIVKPATSPV